MRQKIRIQRSEIRLVATEHLREQIAIEGRRLIWLANHLNISKSHLSHIVAGRRTISENHARVLVALIGGDIGVLFELPNGSNGVSIGRHER